MIKRTLGFVARSAWPPGFLETVIMPDGRVVQISAGNPND
jgi:hypothetical protein